MFATNNLGIYSVGQIGTVLDMPAPKKTNGRRRPPLETFSVDALGELLERIEAVRGKVRAARELLAKHGLDAKVKVNYGPSARDGLNAIGWLADDVDKKIGQNKVFTDEGKLPTDDDDLPAPPSKDNPRRPRGK
jgi:hypothetical protein